MDDGAEVAFFGGNEWETATILGIEIESELVAEDGSGAGAGAVGFVGAVIEDVLHEVEVLLHG